MIKSKFVWTSALLVMILLAGCNTIPTGNVVCPQYQCVKTMKEAKYISEPTQLSGKGPTLFSGTVYPKVKITNPNDEPAKFKVTFLCENKYKHTSDRIDAPEVWLQPKSSAEVQGEFKVGAKENWECAFGITASSINNCELQQT